MKQVNIVGPTLVARGFYDFLVYDEWNSKYRCHAFLNDSLKMISWAQWKEPFKNYLDFIMIPKALLFLNNSRKKLFWRYFLKDLHKFIQTLEPLFQDVNLSQTNSSFEFKNPLIWHHENLHFCTFSIEKIHQGVFTVFHPVWCMDFWYLLVY